MSMTTAAKTKNLESVGAILESQRESLGFSRAEAVRRTKIPEHYIAFLEDGAYDRLPDDVYSKIFLKTYCKFLGLDATAIAELYLEERRASAALLRQMPSPDRHPTTSIPALQLLVAPRIIRGALLVAAVIALALYVGTELKTIVTPPSVSLYSPRDGFVTVERSIAVEGRTEPETSITINGKRVLTDGIGNFKDTLELQEGLNTIRIVASRKHSKEMVLTRRIIVMPKQRSVSGF